MTVTKAQLEQMRAQRPVRNAEMHLRPEGSTVQYVHSTVEADRIAQINRGDRTLQAASNNFRTNMAAKSRAGQSRGAFKSVSAPSRSR